MYRRRGGGGEGREGNQISVGKKILENPISSDPSSKKEKEHRSRLYFRNKGIFSLRRRRGKRSSGREKEGNVSDSPFPIMRKPEELFHDQRGRPKGETVRVSESSARGGGEGKGKKGRATSLLGVGGERP